MIPGIVAGARQIKKTPPVSDPYWANVVSLLHFDNGFTDQKGKVWTSVGTSVISTEQSVFGGASLKSTTAAGVVRTQHSDDFDFGSGDFTIEFWLRPTLVNSWSTYIDKRASGAVFSPFLIQRDTNYGVIRFMASFVAGTWGVLISAQHPTINAWSHVAFTRDGAIFRGFVNGSKVASANAGTAALLKNTSTLNLAATGNNTDGFVGFMDEVRITKGVARYTENFTPPTAPFPSS